MGLIPARRLLIWFAGLILASGLSFTQAANAENPGPLRVGVARLTHGHAGDVFESRKRGQIIITGIFEPDRDLARYYARQYDAGDVPVFGSLEEMIEKTSPEVVTAYGSIIEHSGVVQACAPRGVHVMVEKPLAFSVEQAGVIEELARKHGIQVITNYATTWFPSFHAAFRLVRNQGRVGEIRKVVIHDGHRGPKEIGCGPEFLSWLTDPLQNGGGALIDFGCYGASLMTWLMDGEPPLSVTAVTQQIKPDIYPRVDDEATIILAYPRAQAIIQASWNWPFDRKDMYIYGQSGYAFAPDSRTLLVRTADGDEQSRTIEPRAAPYDNAFSYLTAVVRRQVQPGPTDLSGLEANLTVARILDAARTSAKTGRTVSLR